MRKTVILLLLLVMTLIGCVATDPQDRASEPQVDTTLPDTQPPTLDLTHLNRLIQQLGVDDWPTRDDAHNTLTQLGQEMIQQYRTLNSENKPDLNRKKLTALKNNLAQLADILLTACQHQDPEVSNRTNQIRDHLYNCCRHELKIAFISGSRDYEIYVIDADGSNQKRLTENSLIVDERICWSPDGTKIAFISEQDEKWEIYTMDADGQNHTRLTHNDIIERDLAWSPDGTRIAFVTVVNKQYNQIYTINTDGTNMQRITKTRYSDTEPAWSPDSAKIAFVREDFIYTMDVNGKNQQYLTEGHDPAWSPDSTKIIFIKNHCICVMDRDGKNCTSLAEDSLSEISGISYPSWSPDGTKIVFRVSGGIHVIDTDGKNLTRLTEKFGKYPIWRPSYLPGISPLFAPEEKE